MDELQKALLRLKEREDGQLYEILKYPEEYQPGMVRGARLELIRRGLPDELPENPEVDWSKIEEPQHLSERRLTYQERRRIARIVMGGHREGQRYREILLSFEGLDRAVAAEMLSFRMDHDAFPLVERRHGVLSGAWGFLALGAFLLSQLDPVALGVAVLCAVIAIALMSKSLWGYLLALFWAIIGIGASGVVAVMVILEPREPASVLRPGSSLPLVEMLLLLASTVLFGLLAVMAWRLQKRVFPYLNVFEIRRDRDGRPLILNLVGEASSGGPGSARP